MLILGIDPGTATTGWGVIRVRNIKNTIKSAAKDKSHKKKKKNQPSANLELVDYGCVVTTPKMAFPQRLGILRLCLKKILKDKKPDAIAIEEHFFGQNRRTAMAVSHARGVILETCSGTRVPIHEYQGLAIKKGLTGFGRSDKKEIQRIVEKHLGLKKLKRPKDGFLDDTADALAVAIYHAINS